ncbi:DNA topoisomerase IV, alpha subunit [Annulohypoxylon moriforme]|nr:DNA topoisomerase IV, alpha subunit [Annulohypoxylon moriforme]
MNEQQQNNSTIAISKDATQYAQSRTVISKIEDILEDIINALSENRVLAITIRSRRSGNESLVRFPANTSAEVKRFTCLLQILHLCHEALVSDYIITKRNIYYQNPDLFGNQQYVDNLVDDIAFTFGFGRDSLNIVAAYKGLIAGNVNITLNGNSVLDCSSDDNGILIPHVETIHQIDTSEVKWVMVIEKEGKGYPDLITRRFLHFLHSTLPQVPINALVDFDPSGIDIMLTYKRGSRGLSHEDNITAPRLSWLGPKGCDIIGHTRRYRPVEDPSQAHQSPVFTSPSSQEALIPRPFSPTLATSPAEVFSNLTILDRRKAMNLLSRLIEENDENTSTNTDANGLIGELHLMLMLNIKAEIQAVDNAGDLTSWLDKKLSNRRY